MHIYLSIYVDDLLNGLFFFFLKISHFFKTKKMDG